MMVCFKIFAIYIVLDWHKSSGYTHFGQGSSGKWSNIALTGEGLSGAADRSFSFLSPKIEMGCGIAAKTVKSAMQGRAKIFPPGEEICANSGR